MTRLHHPVTVPGLLTEPPSPGTILVLDSDGNVLLGGSGGGPGDPPNPPHTPVTIEDLLHKEPWPTGPTSGGLISVTGPTEVTIASGEGVIVNSYDDPYNVIVDKISWVQQSIDFGIINNRAFSYVYIDPAGVFLFKTTEPDPAELRNNIHMARIAHDISDGTVVSVRPVHMLPAGTSQMFADFMFAIGVPLLTTAPDVTGNADLTFDTSASQWFGPGESWQQDKSDPNFQNQPAGVPQEFYYMLSTGILDPLAITTGVLPARWENPLGTVDDVASAPNTSTIQRLWTSISGTFVMTYGQIEYANLEDARNAISEDNALFVPPPYITDQSATLVAYFVMERSATDLLNGIDVIIISPEGTPVSGGASGSHTHDTVYLRLDAANDPMQASFSMGGFAITELLDPVLAQDAATKAYVDDNEPHLFYGPRHTDISTITPLSDRHVLVVPAGLGDWTPEYRMNWRNLWIQNTYYTDDVVRDGNYLMAANKETTDRPSPQPIGDASFFLPDIPVWTTLQHTGNVYSGMNIDVPAGQLHEVQAVRVWVGDISATANYQVIIYDAITGLFKVGNSFSGDVLDAPGWVSAPVDPFFVGPDDDFFLLVKNSNSSATTDFDHPWVRTADSNQDNDPGAGNWNQNNIDTRIRISATDDDAVSRATELALVVPGTIIKLQDEADPNAHTEFEVVATTNNTTWFMYDVTLLGTGTSGPSTIGLRQDVFFRVPVPDPTDYYVLTDYFLPFPATSGYLSFDEAIGGALTDDAYGIDMQIQQYSASPDWDLMALTGGTGGGDGGDGANPLPPGGLTDQALTKIDADDFNVQWSGPYLEAANESFLHDDLTDVSSSQHHIRYTDAEAVSAVGPHTTLHDSLTDVSTSQHHVRYSDAEAIAAVDNGTYLKLTGGILTGFLTLNADPTLAFHAATKQYVDGEVFSGSHSDLSSVVTDQHHARYTDAEAISAVGPHTTLLDELTDVDVSGVQGGQILGFNDISLNWEPVENRGNKGIISLSFNYDANQSDPPVSGDVSPNNAEPTLTSIIRISDTDALGDSIGFILDNLTPGDFIVIAPRNDDSIREDYTVESITDEGTWHEITVIPTGNAGTIPDNEPVFFYMFQTLPNLDDEYLRLDATNDPLTGALTLFGAPTADLHAATKKYVDDLPIASTHDELTDTPTPGETWPDKHHARYTDAEAVNAVGDTLPGGGTAGQGLRKLTDNDGDADWIPHVDFQTVDPAPVTRGYLWYDEIADLLKTWDGTQWQQAYTQGDLSTIYLPLVGGTMTGFITLNADPTAALHAATKQYVDANDDRQHTIDIVAPANPDEGDVWVNPDAVDENAYLPLNGTQPMNGAFRAAPGTTLEPGITFDGDTNTGLYSLTNGSIFFTSDGVQTAEFSQSSVLLGGGHSVNAFIHLASDAGVSNPTYSFFGDPNTGMFRSGTDELAFATAGISRLRLRADGNIQSGSGILGAIYIRANIAGSIGFPTYTFEGNEDTGLFRYGLNGVGVTSGGSLALGINANGISYNSITITPGTANQMGLTWGNSTIYGSVDNVVSVALGSSSDRRLKHNLQPLDDALALILNMPPTYSYQTKEFDGTVNDDIKYGQIADEMEPIYPDMVFGDGLDNEEGDPTYQSISYLDEVPILVEAMKQIVARLEALETA